MKIMGFLAQKMGGTTGQIEEALRVQNGLFYHKLMEFNKSASRWESLPQGQKEKERFRMSTQAEKIERDIQEISAQSEPRFKPNRELVGWMLNGSIVLITGAAAIAFDMIVLRAHGAVATIGEMLRKTQSDMLSAKSVLGILTGNGLLGIYEGLEMKTQVRAQEDFQAQIQQARRAIATLLGPGRE